MMMLTFQGCFEHLDPLLSKTTISKTQIKDYIESQCGDIYSLRIDKEDGIDLLWSDLLSGDIEQGRHYIIKTVKVLGE